MTVKHRCRLMYKSLFLYYFYTLHLIVTISVLCFVTAEFKIVSPFPEHIYAIEFTSAKATCVAFDSQDPTVFPKTIKFVRKDHFAIYKELKENELLSFTNRTEGEVFILN